MSKKKVLTASSIAFINLAAICNIKNFPLLAEFGLTIIPLLALAAFFFFIPASLIASELASGWPEKGIYTWVREALGPRWGFIAIWLQWIENVIYYPTLLSFIAAACAYIFDPVLATDKRYIIGVILSVFWLMTIVNFSGMRVSGFISFMTSFIGTLIPVFLIALLSSIWLIKGKPSQISFSMESLKPDFSSLQSLVLLSGVLFGLSGMEMSSVHAKDVKNPGKDYPKAILLSAVLILIASAIGALSIGVIIPKEKIELASGAMEAFRALLDAFHMPWAMPLIAFVVTFGAIGMLSTWIVGPSRGLYATALHGDLPPIFHKANKKDMPTGILLIQAILVSFLCLVFLFMPSINSSYWILLALSTILYQIMYVLMFVSAIVLRYKKPNVERGFRIPFGNVGMWIVCILGSIGSCFGLFISFVPPSQFDVGKTLIFESFLAGLTFVFCLFPIVIYSIRKPSWKLKTDRES